jgi:hypothetical protein
MSYFERCSNPVTIVIFNAIQALLATNENQQYQTMLLDLANKHFEQDKRNNKPLFKADGKIYIPESHQYTYHPYQARTIDDSLYDEFVALKTHREKTQRNISYAMAFVKKCLAQRPDFKTLAFLPPILISALPDHITTLYDSAVYRVPDDEFTDFLSQHEDEVSRIKRLVILRNI